MILLDATVDGKPAALVLDTGAVKTIVCDASAPNLSLRRGGGVQDAIRVARHVEIEFAARGERRFSRP